MKTFFSIWAFLLAVSCAAQTPIVFPHPFTFTPPDTALLAKLHENYPPSLINLKTAYKRVIPDSAMALAHFIAVYEKVNFYFDSNGFDVEAQTLIYYHENGWHNPIPEKINSADDSDVKYAYDLFIYENREDKQLYFDYMKEDRTSGIPLKLILQFLE